MLAAMLEPGDVLDAVYQITTDQPFQERDDEYASMRDLLYQRRWVGIPGVTVDALGRQIAGSVQFRSPEIEDAAHKFKNRMLAAPVKINVAARRMSDASEQAAQRQEDFFRRHYLRWRDQGTFDGALFDQASLGIGWTRLYINNDLLPVFGDYDGGDIDEYLSITEDEMKKFEENSGDVLCLEYIDAATMYWSADERVKIQRARIPLSPLIERYGKQGTQITYDDSSGYGVTSLQPGQNYTNYRAYWTHMAEVYTVETEDYCYHTIGAPNQGIVIGAYKNYFGTPAFFQCVGEKTSSSHPLFSYRALLNGKYQTVPPKNILTTSMVTAGSEASQQRYALEWTGDGPPPEDENVIINVTPDGVVVPPPGYKLVNSGLTVGPDLPMSLNFMGQLDTYGFPRELANPGEVGASSGYDRARQQDAVSSLLDPPLEHFAVMQTDIFRAMRTGVQALGIPITVRSTKPVGSSRGETSLQKHATLSPKDAEEDTDISVTFNSVTVFTRVAMQEEGLKLMQADQLTETQMQLEVMGTDDLQEWRDQRALDKTLKAADDLAVQSVIETIAMIKQATQGFAMAQNGVPQVEPMVPTNGEMLRSDRGPGQPVGPGQSMPANGQRPQNAGTGLAP